MPAAIPILLGAGAQYLALGKLATLAITIGSSLAVSAYERNRLERKAREQFNRSIQDRIITVRGAVAPRTYVLGTIRAGGTLMYAETVGGDKSSLDSVTALCCNQTEIDGYYIGDEFLTVAAFPGDRYGRLEQQSITDEFNVAGSSPITVQLSLTPVPGSVRAFERILRGAVERPVTNVTGNSVTIGGVSGSQNHRLYVRYTANSGLKLRVQFKSGSADQETTNWDVATTPNWGALHRLRGVTYLRTLMLWDEAIFANGAPPIGGVLRGGWVHTAPASYPFFDPRDDSNPTYTDNPALLAAWWMTLPVRLGGMEIPTDWIDWDSVAAAANVCDELVTVRTVDGSGFEQIRRYTCNTVLSTEATPVENLKIILSAMAGRHAFTAGLYRIFAGAFRAATLTITDADVDIESPISVTATQSGELPPNVITGKFADATKNWAETSPKPVVNDTYIALDNREVPREIELPATTDPRRAQYLMGVALESLRPAFGVSLTVTGIGENIALGDTVQLNLINRSAYAGRTLEVVGRVDHWNGKFTLTLSEIKTQTWALDPDSYTPSAQFTLPDLSYLWNVAPIAGLAVDLQTPQTLPDGNTVTQAVLTWNPAASDYVRSNGRIEIRYREIGGQWIAVAPVPGDSTGTTITANLIDSSWYVFEVRPINGMGSAGQWRGLLVQTTGTSLAEGVQGPGIFTWANPVGVDTTSSSITKTSASGAWNAGAHSLQSYSVGCFCTARAADTTTAKMFGLNDDPDVDHNFTGINFAWRADAAGTLGIYENGVLIGTQGSYTAATVLAITYDGVNVRYFRDGTVVRTVAASGLRLFLDVSLFTLGASWVDVTFGPQGGAGAAGAPGAAAQAVRLSATAYAFTFDAAGALSPGGQQITFTASRQNIQAAAVFSTTPSVTLTGSGDTRVLTGANFGANQNVRVRAEASGFFDEITVVRLQQGAQGQAAIVGLLTNEAHTLAADADGVVGSFAGANGLFLVYQGITDVSSTATYSIVSTSNCTAQINTATNTPVAGQPRGFYRVTAVTADQASATLRAVFAGVTIDKVFTVVRARQGSPGDGSNLLRVDDWVVGTTGSQGSPARWAAIGPANESAIVLGGAGTAPIGPLGITEPLWEARSLDNPGGEDPDGGWDYLGISVDAQKTYRSTCWFRINQLSGNLYHGCMGTNTFDLGGGANTNPYFFGNTWSGFGLDPDQWYLSVGIIHGSGYTGGYSGIAGIYDPRTGKRVVQGTEFRMAPGATVQTHRAYHYYDTTATGRQWMARPRFEEVNGNEPSIFDLMGLRLPTPWIERGNCLAGQLTFLKQGGVAAWDSDIYSVQSFTNCHVQIRPSQTNAYFMVGLNTDPIQNQSYDTIDFAWYVHQGGTLEIYESGGNVGSFGSYTTSTELAISYDGSNVRYYKDRVLVRTVAAASQRFYLDSSFLTPGGACRVAWGPGTELETIGTSELAPGAATGVFTTQTGGPVDVSISGSTLIGSLIMPPQPGTWIITCMYEVETLANPSGGFRFIYAAQRWTNEFSVTQTAQGLQVREPPVGSRVMQAVRLVIASREDFTQTIALGTDASFSPPAPTVRFRNVLLTAELIKR